jgi:acetyl-CoA acetyltransferase
MRSVVIVDGVKTPVGNHGAVFRDVDAKELARILANGYAGVEPHRMGIAPAYGDLFSFWSEFQTED